MSKDDQIMNDQVDPIEEEYSQSATSDADDEHEITNESKDSKKAPNLDNIRSAGF